MSTYKIKYNPGDNEQPIWSLPKKKFERYVPKQPDFVSSLLIKKELQKIRSDFAYLSLTLADEQTQTDNTTFGHK